MLMQELRKDGFDLAESRYKELKPILDEVKFKWYFSSAAKEILIN